MKIVRKKLVMIGNYIHTVLIYINIPLITIRIEKY